jgi:regulatory LuxR family protein
VGQLRLEGARCVFDVNVPHGAARGLANKRVARELAITESTVKTHVSSLMSKLELGSRTQLALYAARTGLVALGQTELAHQTGDEQTERIGTRAAGQPSAQPVRFTTWPAATWA